MSVKTTAVTLKPRTSLSFNFITYRTDRLKHEEAWRLPNEDSLRRCLVLLSAFDFAIGDVDLA